MEIEFDPVNDDLNLLKHGVTLADAVGLDFDLAYIIADRRRAYGEDRFQAWGLIEGRLHILAFTMRGEMLRAISLRRANTRETARYASRP